MLLVSISLVTPQAALEFGPKYATLLSASLYAGLLIGALTLGALADNVGRRLIWQVSIFAVSVVTLCAASSPNWAALNVWVALSGYFAGGNRMYCPKPRKPKAIDLSRRGLARRCPRLTPMQLLST